MLPRHCGGAGSAGRFRLPRAAARGNNAHPAGGGIIRRFQIFFPEPLREQGPNCCLVRMHGACDASRNILAPGRGRQDFTSTMIQTREFRLMRYNVIQAPCGARMSVTAPSIPRPAMNLKLRGNSDSRQNTDRAPRLCNGHVPGIPAIRLDVVPVVDVLHVDIGDQVQH